MKDLSDFEDGLENTRGVESEGEKEENKRCGA